MRKKKKHSRLKEKKSMKKQRGVRNEQRERVQGGKSVHEETGLLTGRRERKKNCRVKGREGEDKKRREKQRRETTRIEKYMTKKVGLLKGNQRGIRND